MNGDATGFQWVAGAFSERNSRPDPAVERQPLEMANPMTPRAPSVFAALLLLASGLAQAGEDIEQRTAPCTACHGQQGRATAHGFYPRIAGKPAQYLFNQLINFRDGRRRSAVMSYMVDRQREDYLREMADYFAALQLPYAPTADIAAPSEMLALGENVARRGDASRNLPACTACHGERLTGAPATAGLVGLPRDYILAQFGSWRAGTRNAVAPDCMGEIARHMTEAELAAVATWLAKQPVPEDTHPERADLPLFLQKCRLP